MKRLLLICLGLLLAATVGSAEWKLEKGKHFVVHYQEDESFAGKVLDQAEKNYSRIVQDLGFRKSGDFWLMDDRALIYLYSSRKEFAEKLGAPQWANGKAVYTERMIAGIEGSTVFLDSVLAHELGHLVFRDFIGFRNDVPLWLDEGVAQWEDVAAREMARAAAKRLHQLGRLMPLKSLTAMNVHSLGKTGVAASFYAQSVSLVGFMVEKYGTERFTKFCRSLRDGKSLDDALRFTYPQGLRSMNELEQQWLKSFR